MAIKVSSPAFELDGTIPAKHTGEGQDISPPLEWSELPEGTNEVALICDDPDAPTDRPFVTWVVYKIPADQRGLPEGGAKEALEGRNDFGDTGPRGCGVHHYHFKVYALDAELAADPALSKDELLAAIEGPVLDEGELVGTYQR